MSDTDDTNRALAEKREQVALQYEVVAHLATALAGIHRDIVRFIRDGHQDSMLDMIGARSASIMEQLGDILNGMDANDSEDAWTDTVFERAHKMFPGSKP